MHHRISLTIIMVLQYALNANLPGSHTVEQGQATVQASTNHMTVNQTSDYAVISWDSFDVGKDSTVAFVQPSADSWIHNKVDASSGLSTIAGLIQANGQVLLTNAAGIHFTKDAVVDVHGFIATTASISDDDFMNQDWQFSDTGISQQTITHEGLIHVHDQGLAALVAPTVEQNGLIVARSGKIVIGAGHAYTLDLYGDDLIHFHQSAASDAITMNGVLEAGRDAVVLTTEQAQAVGTHVVNLSTEVMATGAYQQGGKIVLHADNHGQVSTDGQISVNSKHGGEIRIAGSTVNVHASSQLDASGDMAGGLIKIGGDFQGAGTMPQANTLTVAAGASVRADALDNGNGGQVIVWSKDHTQFNGYVSARGGPHGGNGGFAEISGKKRLDYGGHVDLTAPYGARGTLLIDPMNIQIIADNAPQPDPANHSYYEVSTLRSMLDSAAVVLSTNSASGNQSGKIEWLTDFDYTGTSALTLNALTDIIINGTITAANLELTLQTGVSASNKVQWTHQNYQSFDMDVDGVNDAYIPATYREIFVKKLSLNTPNVEGPIILKGASSGADMTIEGLPDGSTMVGPGVYTDTSSINGAVIRSPNIGHLSLKNLNVQANNHTRGIYHSDGDLTLQGITVENGFSTLNGGGVMIENGGNITIKSSTLHNNTSQFDGGGISIVNAKNVTIESSTIQNNNAFYNGGGLCIVNFFTNTDIRFQNIKVNNNDARYGGGGVFIQNFNSNFTSLFTIANTPGSNELYENEFVGNKVTNGVGAGLAIKNLHRVNISGAHFKDNHALLNAGGGMYLSNILQDVTLERSKFTSNSAIHGGGGAMMLFQGENTYDSSASDYDVKIQLKDVAFHNNVSTAHGGGMFIEVQGPFTPSTYQKNYKVSPTFTNVDFVLNETHISGAGLHMSNIDTSGNSELNLTIANTLGSTELYENVFDGNKVSNGSGGGIFLSHLKNVDIQGAHFNNNEAASSDENGNTGGGVSVDNIGSSLNLQDVLIENNRVKNTADHIAGGGGGAFISHIQAPITLTNVTFVKNEAPNDAGGLKLQESSGNVTMKNVVFAQNKSLYSDAVDFFNNTGEFKLTDLQFFANSTLEYRGIYSLRLTGNYQLNSYSFIPQKIFYGLPNTNAMYFETLNMTGGVDFRFYDFFLKQQTINIEQLNVLLGDFNIRSHDNILSSFNMSPTQDLIKISREEDYYD